MVKSLVIIGPGWPLRGGLSAFDEQLARTFNEKQLQARIETFSLQYPSFLFPGTSQYTNEPAPKDVNIHEGINSINPFNCSMFIDSPSFSILLMMILCSVMLVS